MGVVAHGGRELRCSGWALIIAGALETGLVSLWAGSFASTDGPSSPHFYWYVEVPLVFLVAPIVAIATGAYLIRHKAFNVHSEIIVGVAGILLVINLLLFLGYAIISGGGV